MEGVEESSLIIFSIASSCYLSSSSDSSMSIDSNELSLFDVLIIVYYCYCLTLVLLLFIFRFINGGLFGKSGSFELYMLYMLAYLADYLSSSSFLNVNYCCELCVCIVLLAIGSFSLSFIFALIGFGLVTLIDSEVLLTPSFVD